MEGVNQSNVQQNISSGSSTTESRYTTSNRAVIDFFLASEMYIIDMM